jgi:hypothetical protein
MWPLWPETAPHFRDLSGEMQAESLGITKQSLVVEPGIDFAQGCHSLLAAEF